VGFFRAGKAAATCDVRHRVQPAFWDILSRATERHGGGLMVREITIGALAATAWLAVTATLTFTLIAAFIAMA